MRGGTTLFQSEKTPISDADRKKLNRELISLYKTFSDEARKHDMKIAFLKSQGRSGPTIEESPEAVTREVDVVVGRYGYYKVAQLASFRAVMDKIGQWESSTADTSHD